MPNIKPSADIVLGGSIGYALWIIAASGWRITLQKLRPTLK